jgi:hypothetical protein
VRAISLGDLVKERNLNTPVELSDVQFTEVVGRHYFEESNNVGGATNWSLLDKNGNQVILEPVLLISGRIAPSGSGKVREF